MTASLDDNQANSIECWFSTKMAPPLTRSTATATTRPTLGGCRHETASVSNRKRRRRGRRRNWKETPKSHLKLASAGGVGGAAVRPIFRFGKRKVHRRPRRPFHVYIYVCMYICLSVCLSVCHSFGRCSHCTRCGYSRSNNLHVYLFGESRAAARDAHLPMASANANRSHWGEWAMTSCVQSAPSRCTRSIHFTRFIHSRRASCSDVSSCSAKLQFDSFGIFVSPFCPHSTAPFASV